MSWGNVNGKFTHVALNINKPADTTPPDLSAATTADADADGTIDRLTVTFTEPIQDSSVAAGDFTVAGGTVSSVSTGATADDDTVVLTVDGLAAGTDLTPDVTLSAGSVTDAAGNAGPSTDTTVTATDGAAPVITAAATGDADTDGRIDRVTLTYSEGITAASTDASDYDVGGGTYTGEALASDDGDATLVVTFGESGSVDSGATPSVAYAQGTTADAAGNLAPSQTFSGTTDGADPVLVSTSPTDGAAGVSATTDLTLTLSESVQAGSGNVVIKQSADDTTFESISITDSGKVSVSGDTVTVNPGSDLSSATGYYVQVDATAIDDDAGNSYAGIADTTSWNFQTADTAAPSVTVNQPNGGELLAGGSSFEIEWTATDDTGVAADGIDLAYSTDGTSWTTIATGETNDGAYSWTVPSIDSETVQVRVQATDTSGNTGQDTSDATVTVDSTPPDLQSAETSDANGDGTVDRVTVTFTEPVQDSSVGAGDFTVAGGTVSSVSTGATADDDTVVLTVDGLTAGTDLTPDVTLSAGSVADAAANAGPPTDTTLTATDGAAPVITAAVTGDADADGQIDRVTLTYSEGVTAASTDASDYDVDGGTYTGEALASDDGDATLVVTVTESGAFDSGATPGVAYAQGTTADAAGNLAPSQTFTGTADGVDPILVSTSPTDGATGVSTTTDLTLTLSESVQAGSGNVLVKRSADDATVETISITDSGKVSVSGDTVTVNPGSDLSSTTGYYVQVDATALDDDAGNSFKGIADTTSWNFQTADTAAPSVTVNQPNGGEVLTGGSTVEIEWTATDDTGVAADGIDLAYSTDGTSWTTIASGEANDGAYTWTVPSIDSETVLVRVQATDGDGNTGQDTSDAVFTVDSTPPDLQAAETGDADSDGAVDRITATFTEAVQDSSVTAGDFTVSGGTISSVSTGATADDETVVLTVDGLAAGTDLTPDVTLSAGSVTDAAGNAGPSTDTTVTAADGAAPVITTAATGDADTDGQIDRVTLTYSEGITAASTDASDYDVDGGTYTGEVLTSDDGDATLVVTFGESGSPDSGATPSVAYAQGTTADAAGNLAPSQTFTGTADGASPALVSTSPVDGATGVSVTTDLTLTLSESVQTGSGNVLVKRSDDDTTFETISITDSGKVSIAGDTVTVNPTGDLADNTDYYVQVDATAIEDTAGNSFGGIADTISWNFQTADTAAPSVTVNQPNGGEVLAGGSTVEIEWTATDDAGVAADGIDLAYTTDGTSWTTIATGEANDGAYSWTVPSIDSSSVLVRVRATDGDGNTGQDVSDATFTIDSTPPDLQSAETSDANGDGTVDRVTATFTEPIQDSSVAAGDFTVAGGTVSSVSTGATADDDTVVLTVDGLSAGTDLTPDVTLSAGSVADAAANAGPPTDTTLTATDGAAPVITAAVTGDADTDGRIDRVTLTYSEGITAASTSATDLDIAGYTGEALTSDDADATLVVTVGESGSVDSGATPSVAYTQGTMADAAGNLAPSQTFTGTTDGADPVLVSTSPVDDATGVNPTTDLTLTLSESVQAGSGNVVIRRSTDDTTFESVDVTDGGKVSIAGDTVTVDPGADLAANTDYYVQIDATAIEDTAGNAYPGIADTTPWNFQTADTAAPSTIRSVKITDLADNNGIVGPRDRIQIRTTLSRQASRVTANASGFGAGKITLTDPDRDNIYTAVFRVGADTPRDGATRVHVKVKFADRANKPIKASNPLTLDTTPPSLTNAAITDVTDGDGTVTPGDVVDVSAAVSDEHAVEVVTNASAFGIGSELTLRDADGDGTYTARLTVTDAAQIGRHRLTVEASDVAGNSESATTNRLTVDVPASDPSAPGITDATLVDEPDANGVVANADTISVSASVTDPDGIRSVTANVTPFGAGTITLTDSDGDGIFTGTGTVDTTATTDGAFVAVVTATDANGNVGTNTTNTLALDTTPPVVANARIVDEPDGDGFVAARENVTVSVFVVDRTAVTVQADAARFDAGNLTLTSQGESYVTTFAVGRDAAVGAGTLSILATDGAGQSASATTNALEVETLATRYDRQGDGDGVLETGELLAAIRDWVAGTRSTGQILELIDIWAAG